MTIAELVPMTGVAVVIVGFALRLNPLLVVVVAGLATGLAVGIKPLDLLELLGDKFQGSRSLALFLLILPVIGLLERNGLRERARIIIAKAKALSAGRILLLYLMGRQVSAALNLHLGGHVPTVRPLLAPMIEGAARVRHGDLPKRTVEKLKANAAAVENIAYIFGQDIYIAFGAVLLMDAFLRQNGIADIEPLELGLWGIPTAIAALLVHGVRLWWLDRQIARDVSEGGVR
jgi:uncharacterized membrane protein